MKLLIDVPSVLKTGLFVGKDKEFGRLVEHGGKQVQVNGWLYGYDNAVDYIIGAMKELDLAPIDLIFVTEKSDAKAMREAIYANYKKKRSTRPAEYKIEIDRAIEELVRAFRNVGSQIVTQAKVEADDILAYLARNLEGEVVIMTSDGDMTTLINDRVSLWQGNRLTKENKYGPFPHKYVPVYKALCGDGDEYKGATGFGDKSFLDMLVAYGEEGLAAIEGMILRGIRAPQEGKQGPTTLHGLEDDVAEFKPFRMVIDSAEHVYQSYRCALLHDEWVDTMKDPLVWEAGMVRGKDVVTDHRLHPWAQTIYLCTAATYDHVKTRLLQDLKSSPCVGLDIETSTPDESDDWLREGGRDNKVDVFGSQLTGCSLTVGRNNNRTVYFPVDHYQTDNVTSEQVRDLVAAIPQTTPIIVQNFGGFEAPILYAEWGEAMKDNGWHGFLPNVIDTVFCASYVNENVPLGLKQGSKLYLNYDQVTYDEVTKATIPLHDWNGKGHILHRYEAEEHIDGMDIEPGDQMVDVQYKMNGLTGQQVLNYGADDTICSVALYNHFRIRQEIEKTWDAMMEVEQLPAYVTSMGFHGGVNFDFKHMTKLESEDAATSAEMWDHVSQFLVDNNWGGTVTPVFTELTPTTVKEIVKTVLGEELVTRTRTISKLATLVSLMEHDDAPLLAHYIAEGNLVQINDLVAKRFSGQPELDTDSPKQMREFLYGLLGLPIRLVNPPTPLERKTKTMLSRVVSDHGRRWAGHKTDPIPWVLLRDYLKEKDGVDYYADDAARLKRFGVTTTEELTALTERSLLITKARVDEKAVDFALLMDVEGRPEVAKILNSIQTMKKCATRHKFYYKPYAHLQHWKDNKIHGQMGQCRTTTRRYAPNDPNLGQLAKKGEGGKIRECFPPHKKGAVVVSIDFAGQELRQGAAQSGDENMLACFVGDNKKDMHSMTAAGAMEKKWSKAVLADLIEKFGKPDEDEYTFFVRLHKDIPEEWVHKLADDLRKTAKNVNFGAQYGAMAAKLAETLVIPVVDAQAFLDAKYKMFARFEEWKVELEKEIERTGIVRSPMGAIRHLRDGIQSDDWGAKSRAKRQGPSYKIQGGSAEQTKMALGRIWKSGILFRLDMHFYFPIHDELVWSVMPEDALESIRVVHAAMTAPYADLQVPFLGSIAIGPNFGKLIECGDWIIEERIQAAIKKSIGEMVAA